MTDQDDQDSNSGDSSAEAEIRTTWRLAMRTPTQHQPCDRPSPGLRLERATIPQPPLNWFLHQLIGNEFRWGGRHQWGERDWIDYVARDELETWVAYVAGNVAGYFELERQADESERIQRLGLVRQFRGRGFGAALLTKAIERAWEKKAEHLWLTTCSHDHPHALQNYLARGFEIVDQQKGPANLPAEPQIPFGT